MPHPLICKKKKKKKGIRPIKKAEGPIQFTVLRPMMGRLQSVDWTHWTGMVDWNGGLRSSETEDASLVPRPFPPPVFDRILQYAYIATYSKEPYCSLYPRFNLALGMSSECTAMTCDVMSSLQYSIPVAIYMSIMIATFLGSPRSLGLSTLRLFTAYNL